MRLINIDTLITSSLQGLYDFCKEENKEVGCIKRYNMST